MNVLRAVAMIVVVAVTLILLGTASVLHDKTLVAWWIPVAVCAAIAVPCALGLQGIIGRLTQFGKRIWNVLTAWVVVFSSLIGLFYILNFYNTDAASVREYSAPVIRKYTQDRYHTRRVSRNRVVRGDKYRVYFITIELPDGRLKKIEVSLSQYNRIKTEKQLSLQLETGLFGVPVIKNMSFPVREHHREPPKRLYRGRHAISNY